MKTVQKERKSFYDVYVAYDGTEFTTADDCRKYESSAKAVVMSKIKPLVIKELVEDDIFGFGSCESTVWVMKPVTQNDADAILQAYVFVNQHLADDDHLHYVERARNLLQRAIDEDDVIFIGRGYEMDSFWFVGTPASMKEQLDKLATPDEKKDDNA